MKSKIIRSVALGLGLWALAPAARSQHTAAATQTPSSSGQAAPAAQGLSPQALIDRAVAAEGGPEAFLAADTHAIMEGEMQVLKPFPNTVHLVMYRKDDKLRMNVQAGAINAIVVMTKNGGWKSVLGSVADLSPEELNQQRLEEGHKQSLLLEASKKGYNLTALGKKKLPDGVSADAVRVTTDAGDPTDFYFDSANGRVIAIGFKGKNALSGRDVRSLQRLIAGKTQNGHMVTGEMRMYEDGEIAQVLKITKNDTTTEIADSLFERPGAAKAISSAPVTLPFDFSTGELVVTATVNGKPRRFMVDTGAGITLMLPQAIKALGLKATGKANLGGGGGAASAKFAKINSLRLGNAELKNLDVAVADVSGLDSLVGGNLAGVLGYNVLSNFQVTLDYGKKELTLAPKDSPLPSGTPVKMDIFSNIALVDAVSGDKKFRMMIDSGAMWTILPPRVAPLLKFQKVTDGAMAMGIDGSPISLKTARLSDLTIGDRKVEGTLVSFAKASEKSTGALLSDFANGILGNTYLRQFRVTLDYAKGKAVFAPLPGGDPYPDEWTHPGLLLAKLTPESGAIIAQIVPDSPAAKAGLQMMDAVATIDDKPTRTMTQAALANALRGPADSTVRLKVLHNGKPKTLILKRVRLL